MIALAIAMQIAAPSWVPVGETASRLRVFVDKASVRDVDGRRHARVRIGAPHAIVGKVVLAFEDEEFDCPAHTWRLLAFEARDEDDKVIRRSPPDTAAGPMLPVVDHTIGGEVAKAVCAL